MQDESVIASIVLRSASLEKIELLIETIEESDQLSVNRLGPNYADVSATEVGA